MRITVTCILLANLVELVTSWNSYSSLKQRLISLDAVSRRSVLSTGGAFVASGMAASVWVPEGASAEDDKEQLDFSSIANRAAEISQALEETNSDSKQVQMSSKPTSDGRTAYDFALPVAGETVNFGDLVRQNDAKDKVKAILVVNIKQDDPIARKDIPEFITLASKYGREGEFVVVLTPTDQGYYEPDTSTLIRLKLASEYGYGINPATTLTDKMILLGTGAHPFWRWLEGTCRSPSGLGRIQGNFEKFLLDGRTGLPLRRYPRKYMPHDIADDIESLLAGKPLPPPGSNFKEEWRIAANDALRDTYRFQKGLNVFDQ